MFPLWGNGAAFGLRDAQRLDRATDDKVMFADVVRAHGPMLSSPRITLKYHGDIRPWPGRENAFYAVAVDSL